MLVLAPHAVDVWCVRSDATVSASSIAGFGSLMSAEESARYSRYQFERDRREYLVTRALCRTTLSRYAPVRPRDWIFRTNEFGRPEIDRPGDHAALRFNLSNTAGMVVCAVATDRDIGIDVESLKGFDDVIELAQQYFAPREASELLSLPEHAQLERFLAYWTLKEAYVKARGAGLSIPLDQFAFRFHASGIDIDFEPSMADDPLAWHFAKHAPTAAHRIAVALRGAPREQLDVRFRHIDLASILDDGAAAPIASTAAC